MTPEQAADVRQFLESRNDHLGPFTGGLDCFDWWIRDRAALDPSFIEKLTEVSRDILVQGDSQLSQAALLSLAVAGSLNDRLLIARYASGTFSRVTEEANACVKFLDRRFKTIAQLRTEVCDRESFIAFAYALIDDRERNEPPCAGVLESWSDRPQERWETNSISDYLTACLSYFVRREPGWDRLSWPDMAAFFDCGRASDASVSEGAMDASQEDTPIDDVADYDSFVAFVRALIKQRRRAEALERENPEYWSMGGAEDWQNSRISDFLGHAMLSFEDMDEVIGEPAWADLADALFQGKIRE